MTPEIFITRLRSLEADLLTLSQFADRIAKGHENFTLDSIHPVEPLSTAIYHLIQAASEGITSAVLVLDSWERITEICDDSNSALNHNSEA